MTDLCRLFPWVRTVAKLHVLLRHAPDFVDFYVSSGLYGKQGNEAWDGHMNAHVADYPAATEAESAAKYLRARALARDASHRLPPTRRSPAAPGARCAIKQRDGRPKQKKDPIPLCDSTEVKAVQETLKCAASLFCATDRNVSPFLGRLGGSQWSTVE